MPESVPARKSCMQRASVGTVFPTRLCSIGHAAAAPGMGTLRLHPSACQVVGDLIQMRLIPSLFIACPGTFEPDLCFGHIMQLFLDAPSPALDRGLALDGLGSAYHLARLCIDGRRPFRGSLHVTRWHTLPAVLLLACDDDRCANALGAWRKAMHAKVSRLLIVQQRSGRWVCREH